MASPVVSIVTPVYNAGEFLDKTLDSVIAQSLTDWELIAVDDASPDNSLEVLQEYAASDSRIKVVALQENQGPGAVRNIGLEKTTGEYVAFLDADDFWHPDKLQLQLDFMTRNDLLFSSTGLRRINREGALITPGVLTRLKFGLFQVRNEKQFRRLFIINTICTSTVMVRNSDAVRFPPSLRVTQDLYLWFELLAKGKYGHLEDELTDYRILAGSISRESLDNSYRELLEVLEHFNCDWRTRIILVIKHLQICKGRKKNVENPV